MTWVSSAPRLSETIRSIRAAGSSDDRVCIRWTAVTLISDMIPASSHHTCPRTCITQTVTNQWSVSWTLTNERPGHRTWTLAHYKELEDMCPDSLWIVGAGQLICLIKTKTSPSPHVMIHRYNLSKLHLYHQLWVKLGQWEVATLPFLLKLWNKSSRKAANNCKSVIKYSFFSSM